MNEDTKRTVTLRRTAPGELVATNPHGAKLRFGTSGDCFTPVETLLAAIGACTGLDVDALVTRRAEPESFEIQVEADRVRDETGNKLENVEVVFRVSFPAGDAGDATRKLLPELLARSHDRLCTVSRTVEAATPVRTRLD